MAELKYSMDGFWIEKADNYVLIGLSDKGQDDLGEVSFINLPTTGEISKDDVLIGVEAAKAVTELPAPLSGIISEVNEALSNEPAHLNSMDRTETWIVKMTGVDEEAYASLENESGLE